VSAVAFTPAGDAITFLARRGDDEHKALWSIPVDGGEARRLRTHDGDILEYALSPDGRRVAYLAKEPLPGLREKLEKKGFSAEIVEEQPRFVRVHVAALESGADAEPTVLELDGSASMLSWSPRGDLLAVALAPSPSIDDRYMRRRIHLVDAASGRVVRRFETPGKLGPLAWAPDGSRVAFLSAADPHDPSEGRLVIAGTAQGEPLWVGRERAFDFVALAFAGPDRVLAVVHEGLATRLVAVDANDGSMRTLSAPDALALRSVAVSRDGRRAVLVADAPDHPREVWTWSAGDPAPTRRTDSNPALGQVELARQEPVRYTARDGLEIEGLLLHPLARPAGKRVPLVVVVHGGPEAHWSNGWITRYANPGQVLAARGYAVFYPNYRGSTGRGVAFSKLDQADYAGPEFDDLVDGVRHLVARGLVDEKKVGVTGGSYGGFATAWCATALTEHFAAGVMFVGISDHISKYGTTEIPHEMYMVHSRKFPWEDWEFFEQRSPLRHVEKARTPLLIAHGTDDTRVPTNQSRMLYRYLKTLGKVPVRLVLYPGEGHGNRRAAARYDYGLRLLRWFDHYLTGPGGTPPPPDLPELARRMAASGETDAEHGRNRDEKTAR
ncbi:MAG: S9 family peptidase, partial [Acidobacteria bacterium]